MTELLYYGLLFLGGIGVLVLVLYILGFFIDALSRTAGVLLRVLIPITLLVGAAYLIHLIVSGQFPG